MEKKIFDNLLRWFLIMVVMFPIVLILHDSLILKGVAICYMFLLWFLVRKPSREE